jgi:hypothetical protein
VFGSFAFAQAYFAGVLEIVRRAVRGGIGGSGMPPNWAAIQAANAAENERLRREHEAALERELADLYVTGLLY